MNTATTETAMHKLNVEAQGEREIVLTRAFDAPREDVWNALSRPELLRCWWGLASDEMTTCEMDFRVGGAWHFVVAGVQGEHSFRGQYCEIAAPERIVQTFEWEGMPGHVSRETLTLCERDGQTVMTIVCAFDSRADRDGMLASGMEQGAGESYNRLESLLHKRRGATRLDRATVLTLFREVSQVFVYNLDFIAEDKIDWKPEPDAKSALEILNHLAKYLDSISAKLGATVSDFTQAHDRESAKLLLTQCAQRYETAVQNASAAILNGPFRDDMPLTLGWMVTASTLDTIHHAGQIAYIQTLLGDKEIHFDPSLLPDWAVN